jgi:zinc transport system substrate-binding protein
VNYPLAYFAERIGGKAVDVHFPVPADMDPAWWTPTPEEIARFQEADLILLNGATYAKWVLKASLPASRVVDTSASVADRYIQMKGVITHSHGPEGKHTHKGTAFTTWLDPNIAVVQAKAVLEALVKLVPAETKTFEDRFDGIERDLRDVADAIRMAVAQDPSRPVLFSHPVYQYLERAFSMNGRSVHWESNEEPDENMWKELDALLAEHPAKVMIWESPPLPDVVTELEHREVKSVVFDPGGNKPSTGDFLTLMKAGAEALHEAYQ